LRASRFCSGCEAAWNFETISTGETPIVAQMLAKPQVNQEVLYGRGGV
jgi:hypothetical protein